MKIKSKYNGKVEKRVAITRADDADFCTSGDNSETKLQKIVSPHVKMYEATGGKA